MQISEILRAIENIKLDRSSKDYIEVSVEDLSTLYSHIRRLESKLEAKQNSNETLKLSIESCKQKISFLNSLVHACTPKPKLTDYYA